MTLSGSGSINVNGLGYPGGYSFGATAPSTATASLLHGGGSHGGSGGSNGTANVVGITYGDYRAPVLPGAGSGGGSNAGGGAVYFNVTGDCTMASSASITADGGSGAAGGSVWLKCNTLGGSLGTKAISASGGAAVNSTAPNQFGGGGGGRIALETTANTGAAAFAGDLAFPTDTTSRDAFVTKVQARGGAADGTYHRGGAGTIFLKHSGIPYGALILENGGAALAANEGRTLFVSTTANNNSVTKWVNNNTMQITPDPVFPATSVPAVFTVIDLLKGAQVHMFPNGASANLYDASHLSFVLSGNSGDNLLKIGGANFPAAANSNHKYRIVQQLNILDLGNNLRADFAGSDVMLEGCSFAGNTTFAIGTGASLQNINSVASPVCTTSSLQAVGGSTYQFGQP